MDIDKILHTKVEVNNDREKLTAYNLSRGPSYSLNENRIPEQLFDNPDTPEKEADGVSATKALSLAAQQGQTIYTITKANYAEILPKLNHSNVVMTDIRNGVNTGKTVTVHDTQITLNGWSGTGYTILDPESGAGAYMIGGGLDGGQIEVSSNTWNLLSYMSMVAGNFSGYVENLAKIGGSDNVAKFLGRIGKHIGIARILITLASIPSDCAEKTVAYMMTGMYILMQLALERVLVALAFTGWGLLIYIGIIIALDAFFVFATTQISKQLCTRRES